MLSIDCFYLFVLNTFVCYLFWKTFEKSSLIKKSLIKKTFFKLVFIRVILIYVYVHIKQIWFKSWLLGSMKSIT